jgi:hypothetical protein
MRGHCADQRPRRDPDSLQIGPVAFEDAFARGITECHDDAGHDDPCDEIARLRGAMLGARLDFDHGEITADRGLEGVGPGWFSEWPVTFS